MKNVIEIKESLINQLKNKKANTNYFLGLIDDYVWYFNQEKEMQQDIKARGRHYRAKSASGYLIDKENESLKNAVTFNKQKLAILKQLGLTIENVIPDDADDEM
ncbi:P27 family phage terminase small subunit [Clostridium tagluense]|nr:P27 family phage terminase small subunit [Clostridium tagluense]